MTLTGSRLSISATHLVPIAACLVAILPYLTSIKSYFIGDDFGYVQLFAQKPTLHFISLFKEPWTEDVWRGPSDELRPIAALSFQFNSLWGVNAPDSYHVINVIIHALTTLAVFCLARSVAGLSLPVAAFAAVLFAVFHLNAAAVVWITGRPYLMFALFYVLAFLAYARWRRTGQKWLYVGSLAAFVLALFSKEPAITLLTTLIAYDILIERRSLKPSWPWLYHYGPFLFLTMVYLGLRQLLFGQSLREGSIEPSNLLSTFADMQLRYLQLLLFGQNLVHMDSVNPELRQIIHLMTIALAAAVLLGALLERRRKQADLLRSGGLALYFGPVWWLICTAPLLVTYVAARHLYLASAGAAIGVAAVLQLPWDSRRRGLAYAGALLGAGLIGANAVAVHSASNVWLRNGRLSEQIVHDVERQALDAPPGSLFVLKAPDEWKYAVPFAFQPPFVGVNLTDHVSFLEMPHMYCCPTEWFQDKRGVIEAWSRRDDRPPVIVLRWACADSSVARWIDAENPGLRNEVLALLEASEHKEMRTGLRRLHERLGHDRGDTDGCSG